MVPSVPLNWPFDSAPPSQTRPISHWLSVYVHECASKYAASEALSNSLRQFHSSAIKHKGQRRRRYFKPDRQLSSTLRGLMDQAGKDSFELADWDFDHHLKILGACMHGSVCVCVCFNDCVIITSYFIDRSTPTAKCQTPRPCCSNTAWIIQANDMLINFKLEQLVNWLMSQSTGSQSTAILIID